jgi:hypothetical protein
MKISGSGRTDLSSSVFRLFEFPNKNLVIKETISGSGRTELSTFVVRVTHFTDLEIRKLHLLTF